MDCTIEQYSPELPESIIHRIQSLLNSKKAAQTTLLSKPWLRAWSTRPAIVLDEADFETDITSFHPHIVPRFNGNIVPSSPYPRANEFPKFAKKTLKMYKQSNHCIHTFKLSLKSCKGYTWYVRSGLAIEWTLKALKLGATDLTFEINQTDMAILLDEVSGRENVSSLRLQSSKIDQLQVFKCPGLKSLDLSKSCISRESLFNIISGCPLIENLSLQSVHVIIDPQSRRYRGYVAYDENASSDDDDEEQQQQHGGEEEEEGQQQQQQQHVVRSAPPEIFLHNLRSLALCRVSSKFEIKALFLDDLSSKFPNLKHLTLKLSLSNLSNFRKQGEMHTISSGSLEVLSFGVGVYHHHKDYDNKMEMVKFEFDVPCMREFTLDCKSYMPNMCFTPESMDRCESHVSLTHHGMLSIKWFRKLSKLLTGLNGSKINLFLRVDNRKSFHYRCGHVTCMSVCELENLTMNTEGLPSMSFINLLDGLFRICRPKMITQYIGDKDYDVDDQEEISDDDDDDDDDDDMSIDDPENTENNDEILFHELQEAMKYKSILIPSRQMYGLRDLEEVHVEKLFDGVWMRSQPLDSILDDSHRKFRLQLKWKSSPYVA